MMDMNGEGNVGWKREENKEISEILRFYTH